MQKLTIELIQLFDEYAAGPQKLQEAIAGMTAEQIDAGRVSGNGQHAKSSTIWPTSSRSMPTDRMKRANAENEPTIFGGDPGAFAARFLADEQREIEEELQMIESIRKHMARIFRTLPPGTFQRKVNHSEDGPITLRTLSERITNHVPPHIQFIEEQKRALASRRAKYNASDDCNITAARR